MNRLTEWARVALRSSVARNAAWLYVIQFSNYLLPLVAIPYLVRALGPAGYGKVAFSQSVAGFLSILVDYGFALSATRQISAERSDRALVGRIACSVWAAKALLALAAFAALLLTLWVFPKLHEMATLIIVSYGLVIGNALFPVWLFQGMERMQVMSAINLAGRLLVTAGTFAVIHRPEDCLLYIGLIVVGALGSGACATIVALRMFGLALALPSWEAIRHQLVDGWLLFLVGASTSVYSVGNAFVLGVLTTPTEVGYYSAADKVVRAAVALLGPLSQACYPRFSMIASRSKADTMRLGARMFLLVGGLGLSLSTALFVGSPQIARVALGPQYGASVPVMRMLAALPLLIGASNVLGVQIMCTLRLEKAVASIVLAAGILNLGLAVLLVPLWSASGMAVAVVATEAFVGTGLAACLEMKRYGFLGTVRTVLWGEDL